MFNLARKAFLTGIVATFAVPAFAADLALPPPVIEQPPIYEAPAPDYGGWYIRGDIDYHKPSWRGADYITYGSGTPAPGTNSFTSGSLKGAFSLGAGIGYQINDHFRTDLTADYWFKSDFDGRTDGCGGTCTSTEVGSMSALLLLANAYVDIGTWNGITPYVGAGIGGAHIKWGSLHDPNTTEYNPGSSNWRFAYALMAGASYCLTERATLDVGYRFTHIQGGRMFEYHSTSAGPGFDNGLNVHEARAGLRYSFGGPANGCAAPVQVVYEPQPEPLYTK